MDTKDTLESLELYNLRAVCALADVNPKRVYNYTQGAINALSEDETKALRVAMHSGLRVILIDNEARYVASGSSDAIRRAIKRLKTKHAGAVICAVKLKTL